jgi:hypothetical protein
MTKTGGAKALWSDDAISRIEAGMDRKSGERCFFVITATKAQAELIKVATDAQHTPSLLLLTFNNRPMRTHICRPRKEEKAPAKVPAAAPRRRQQSAYTRTTEAPRSPMSTGSAVNAWTTRAAKAASTATTVGQPQTNDGAVKNGGASSSTVTERRQLCPEAPIPPTKQPGRKNDDNEPKGAVMGTDLENALDEVRCLKTQMKKQEAYLKAENAKLKKEMKEEMQQQLNALKNETDANLSALSAQMTKQLKSQQELMRGTMKEFSNEIRLQQQTSFSEFLAKQETYLSKQENYLSSLPAMINQAVVEAFTSTAANATAKRQRDASDESADNGVTADDQRSKKAALAPVTANAAFLTIPPLLADAAMGGSEN